MCLKPQPPRPMPEDTRRVGAALLDKDSPYRFIGDVLYEQFHDEDFADLYPNDGQPALSPVLLSFVTIFQYLEDLSDRDAALALKDRISWKYALHLPLTYASFDRSVLVEFRIRLRTHKAEGRVFDAVLARLKDMGHPAGKLELAKSHLVARIRHTPSRAPAHVRVHSRFAH